MKSAVDFLIGELLKNKLLALRYDKDQTIDIIINNAKEIEKNHIVEAWTEGNTDYLIKIENGEEYYEEKFKKK